MSASQGKLAALFARHRRRLARVVFALGLLAVAAQLFTHVPRETELEFELGEGHAQVIELRVGFERGGEEMHGVSFGFPEGAPSRVRHSMRLPSGEYVVRAELRERDGDTRRYTRKVIAPADGVVQIPLTGRAARAATRPAGDALGRVDGDAHRGRPAAAPTEKARVRAVALAAVAWGGRGVP